MKVLLAVLSVFVLSMPTARPALAGNLTITDVKELAGTWEGGGRSTYGSSRTSTTLTILEDGTYTAVGQGVAQGKIELLNGRLLYDSTFSSGTMTVEERDGKHVLLGTGTTKRGGVTITGEYVRTK